MTSECTQLPSKYTEHAERAGTRAGAANATVLSIARSGRGRGERKTCTGAVELGVWAGEDSRDEEEEGVEEPRKQPYAVQASMMHSGLGPKLWWLGEDELAQEAQDEPAEEMDVDGGAEQEAAA